MTIYRVWRSQLEEEEEARVSYMDRSTSNVTLSRSEKSLHRDTQWKPWKRVEKENLPNGCSYRQGIWTPALYRRSIGPLWEYMHFLGQWLASWSGTCEGLEDQIKKHLDMHVCGCMGVDTDVRTFVSHVNTRRHSPRKGYWARPSQKWHGVCIMKWSQWWRKRPLTYRTDSIDLYLPSIM